MVGITASEGPAGVKESGVGGPGGRLICGTGVLFREVRGGVGEGLLAVEIGVA
jgi:hypothetical protein